MAFQQDEDTNLNGTLDVGEDLNSDMNLDMFTPPRLLRRDNSASSTEDWWDALVSSRDGVAQGESRLQIPRLACISPARRRVFRSAGSAN